jgi:hypothetical protein
VIEVCTLQIILNPIFQIHRSRPARFGQMQVISPGFDPKGPESVSHCNNKAPQIVPSLRRVLYVLCKDTRNFDLVSPDRSRERKVQSQLLCPASIRFDSDLEPCAKCARDVLHDALEHLILEIVDRSCNCSCTVAFRIYGLLPPLTLDIMVELVTLLPVHKAGNMIRGTSRKRYSSNKLIVLTYCQHHCRVATL